MKKTILFLLLAVSFSANAQSLKDLLYSGKMKSDSGTVVRKGDDLSTKIDTATRKPAADAEKPKTITVVENPAKTVDVSPDSAAVVATVADNAPVEPAAKEKPAPVKSNTKLWKEYTDSVTSILKTEVFPNKKIKKETYYFTVEYEIDVDGQVNILNVTSDPENAFLQSEVKTKMELSAPKLNPVESSGKPKKVKRRASFSVTKE